MKSILAIFVALLFASGCRTIQLVKIPPISPPTAATAKEYGLDTNFYKKTIMADGILVATSDNVSDYALTETAYLFGRMMGNMKPEIARRIRDAKVLCILVGYQELTSDVPQFKTNKTGKELDFYNWRQRGFLRQVDKRPIVLFAEEDILEFKGGQRDESILIHEFGHVIHHTGFDDELNKRVKATYEHAVQSGLWNDGLAAQYYRVKSETPVNLIDALAEAFPEQPAGLFAKCIAGGDIRVNDRRVRANAMVTRKDRIKILFGGPKQCYAGTNHSEYFAEMVQDWYDTNRTNDHDHNHIHTRRQLWKYDPMAAQLCEDVLGHSPWRFRSPRTRAGNGHLAGFKPEESPTRVELPHIKKAAEDHFMAYWKDYWQRLRQKYGYEEVAGKS